MDGQGGTHENGLREHRVAEKDHHAKVPSKPEVSVRVEHAVHDCRAFDLPSSIGLERDYIKVIVVLFFQLFLVRRLVRDAHFWHRLPGLRPTVLSAAAVFSQYVAAVAWVAPGKKAAGVGGRRNPIG
jgi:hypothetical protein